MLGDGAAARQRHCYIEMAFQDQKVCRLTRKDGMEIECTLLQRLGTHLGEAVAGQGSRPQSALGLVDQGCGRGTGGRG